MVKQMLRNLVLLVAGVSFMVPMVSAQTNPIEEIIDKQADGVMKFFSSVARAGYVNTADIHSVLGFDVGLKLAGGIIPDEFRELQELIPGLKYEFSENKVTALPFLTANLAVFPNFELMARIAYDFREGGPSGQTTLVGGGVKYGILQQPLLPKIVVIGTFHTLFNPEGGELPAQDDPFNPTNLIDKLNIFSAKAYISKDFAILTLYGGGGVDRTHLDVAIPPIVPGLPDGFEKDYNTTEWHLTAGATATIFPFVRVNGEFNVGPFKSLALGAIISVR